jgi:subtilisin family serine protease
MIRWLSIFLLLCCAGCATLDRGLPLLAREHPERFVVVTVRNDSGPISTRAGSTPRGYDGLGYGPGPYASHAVRALAATYRLEEISGWPIAELGVHCVVFRIPPEGNLSEMLDRLTHDGRVESAQPLNTFATRSASYNDAYQDLQGSLNTMSVTEAHRLSRGTGVHVAVIDTGADTSHPDLAGRVIEQRNFVDDDMNAFTHDRHGTAIAGVIAADSNNRIGIVGVAPEARLHIYKACWEQGAPAAACNTFTLAKGLAAAIDARVQIVNLSLAGPQDSLLTRLVMRAQERGVIFVGAMPQSPASAEALTAFPVGIAGVLKVAAAGSDTITTDALHAPGVDVLTLAPQGRYDFFSGNSLATAGVTGAVALLLSRDRSASAARLQQLLTASSPAKSGVDACAALTLLLHEGSCNQPIASE